jgi:lia operon protein LiaG
MNSGSGSLEARGVKGSLNASTGSGNIVAEGAVASDWRLRTSSGSVRIDLPSEAAFTVEARSSSGSVEVNHPLTLQGRIGRREVRGTVRGGGSLLAVSTSSGSIQID